MVSGYIDFEELKKVMTERTDAVSAKIKEMGDPATQAKGISVTAMFELQMLMNQLSQFSEMTTSVISSSNSSIASMARNVKS